MLCERFYLREATDVILSSEADWLIDGLTVS